MFTGFPNGVTVTVLDGGGFDDRGNPLPETESAIDWCGVAPGGSEDIIDQATGAVAEYVIYAPAGTQVAHTARIRLPDPWGGTWSVAGKPQHWINPLTGWSPGVRIYLAGRQG